MLVLASKSHPPCVVRGNELTCIGTDASIDAGDMLMHDRPEANRKGKTGAGEKNAKGVRVQVKLIHVTAAGLTYEPDPGHVELLARERGLVSDGKSFAVPGWI